MFILGLQGSPRKKGNSNALLSSFLEEAEKLGAETKALDVPRMNITPCQECGTCEKGGKCPIKDDMQEVYVLFRRADLIVLTTPVFFYGATAQLKALVDRAQNFWSRRYIFNLNDPRHKMRRGFSLGVGATKGKDLFDGIDLMSKYFYDAVSAKFEGSLNFRKIEAPGDMAKHPTALAEARQKARELSEPFMNRKKILFLCTENACRSQMASAFAQLYAGDKFEVNSAGSAPAHEVNPLMIEVMHEKGIDMDYRRPKSIEAAVGNHTPGMIILMGCGDVCPMYPGVETIQWDLPDPAKKSIEFMREVRDIIEEKVQALVS